VVDFTMKWAAESAPMFRRILAGERVPLFAEVNRENYELYEYLSIDRSPDFPGRGLVWVCFDAKALASQRETNRAKIEKLARSLRRNFSFVWIDTEIYGEQAELQIGCNMDTASMPALIVHIPGDRPANLRRHQFNGADGVFDEITIGKFFENVLADKAEYFFRSKADGDLIKDQAVPEISSITLEAAIVEGANSDKAMIVGVTVKERELCAEACDKFISDLAVISALVGIPVRLIDGVENDPPRPFVFWENVPYLFVVKNGKQLRFNAQSGDFSLKAMLTWIKDQLGVEVDAALLDGDEARRLFVDGISDSTLKAEVEKALFGKNEDDWDLEEIEVSTTAQPKDDEWDLDDDEL
jgi:hypothetical protein